MKMLDYPPEPRHRLASELAGPTGALLRTVRGLLLAPQAERRPGERRRGRQHGVGLDWHPHFGRIGGCSLETWLARYPDAVAPARSIVLATDERTGSEWLCQLLGATGRLGRPSEYLNTLWMRRFIPDYPDDVPAQLSIAHHVGTTANGCFAMKLHPWHVDRLLAGATCATTFPAPVFVRLLRHDLLGQAISLYRARATARYHFHYTEKRTVAFDGDAIEAVLRELAANRTRWDAYFARNAITPLVVSYEALRAHPLEMVRRVAALVGETVRRRDIVCPSPMCVQADAQNEEWRERFVRERSDLNRFDPA